MSIPSRIELIAVVLKIEFISLALMSWTAAGAFASEITGSGVIVGDRGEVLTAAHVVSHCERVQLRVPPGLTASGEVIEMDTQNDVAILRADRRLGSYVTFALPYSSKTGDAVTSIGFPLAGLLSPSANISSGIISSEAGVGNDIRYLQVTAPTQPGSSGGPLLNNSGELIGIMASKLDFRVAALTGAIPENVNFAIKSEIAALLLNSAGIPVRSRASSRQLSTSQIAEQAKNFTVFVSCSENGRRPSVKPRRHISPDSTPRRDDWMRQLHPDWLKHN